MKLIAPAMPASRATVTVTVARIRTLWPQPSAVRIEKLVLVTLPADLRAGNVMWLLSVGGRAYAGRNGDLWESC